MRQNTLKLMACASLFAFGIGASTQANAQQVDVPITLTVTNAIDIQAGDDMDFGEYILVDGSTDSTLVMNPDSGAIALTPGTGAIVVNITPSAGRGTVTVETPAATSVDMFGTITDFAGPTGLAFTLPFISINNATPIALSTASGSPTAVATTGGLDTIGVGGTITMSATPSADGLATANIQVDVSY